MTKAPESVLILIENFKRNYVAYKSVDYKEEQLKQEFLNPLFEALEWDVANKEGSAPQYRDVIFEDSIKVGTALQAPDYCFTMSGVRKFFVEAKKPAIEIERDQDSSYQLRRYAWSAKLRLSILTNFETFAIYESRVRPRPEDKASVERVKLLTYEQFAEKWDEIADIFSKRAVRQGSFDNFIETVEKKRGTQQVDDEFLNEIENWRDDLARNVALRNPALSIHELNYSVQRTIDRIIFIRMCEDRGIERYGQVQALLNTEKIYEKLCQIFKSFDEKYNSGLFHFERERGRSTPPDEITLKLVIDDVILKRIIKDLYYPDCPYEFSVIPTEVLGNIYERFLGKVIRLTEGHRAKVEEKPEVKKAGGVFYTPKYIVDYITSRTLGRLCEGKTPKFITSLHIVDPACGSGSFLLSAYSLLLKYHLDYYTKQEKPSRFKDQIYLSENGEWLLTIKEKKRILLNNIYGVDIDRQAVEVTKLSLLLKVLEGESKDIFERQQKLYRERALPDLDSNIKCGNSLVESDFYRNGVQRTLDLDEVYRVNAFDWKKEFEDIFSGGGFDVVVGNPPYLRIQGLQEYYGDQVKYFTDNFESAVKRFDLSLLFVERGFKHLKSGGLLGFILPNKFINADYGEGVRKFLSKNAAIDTFVSFGNNLVFSSASTYTGILLLSNLSSTEFKYYTFPNLRNGSIESHLLALTDDKYNWKKISELNSDPWILTKGETSKILSKIQIGDVLGDVMGEILVGVQSGIDDIDVLKYRYRTSNDTFVLFSQRAGREVEIESGLVKPLLIGEDVDRFSKPDFNHYIIYPYVLENGKTRIMEERELEREFPLGFAYLGEYRKELTEIRTRQRTNPKYWYSCHRSRDMNVFEADRIVTPAISLGCNMTICKAGIYQNTKVYSLVPRENIQENMLYWLGILNSRLMWYFLKNTGTMFRGGYYVFATDYLKPFPVRRIDFSIDEDKMQHERMVNLVTHAMDLHRRIMEVKSPPEKVLLQRQIENTDHEIDMLVYKLYTLSHSEVRIVEESQ